MLPATARLRRRTEFSSTVHRGRRGGSALVVVHLDAQPSDPGPAQVGFVVSKAVGSAVRRNRTRRRLRHVMRERLAGLPSGGRLVIRALPGAATASSAALTAALDRALGQAGIPRATRTRS